MKHEVSFWSSHDSGIIPGPAGNRNAISFELLWKLLDQRRLNLPNKKTGKTRKFSALAPSPPGRAFFLFRIGIEDAERTA